MIALITSAISYFTHFSYFGRPASVVFDEVFYGNFLANYWQGIYFFDQHPPFFKVFMAFVGYITGASNYSADWATIGNFLPETIVSLRILPMIAGVLLSFVIYYLCRKLNFSKLASFIPAFLLCFENSLIVQSRFILPDVVMLFAGFASIFFYLHYARHREMSYKAWFFAASSILAGIALSIKWTGATYLFIIFAMELYRLVESELTFGHKKLYRLKKFIIFVLKYIVVATAIYVTLFAIHFSALPYSGKGDIFMSPQFQKTLTNNPYSTDAQIMPAGFGDKFLELNKVMYTANSGMTATHSYSSKWYTWPIMQRSIFYWQDVATSTADGRTVNSYIYLLGNPVIYWFGSASILLLIIFYIFKIIFGRKSEASRADMKTMFFLVIGYLVNLLPFMFIGRVMFLYHYETALIFSVMATAFIVDKLPTKLKHIAVAILLIMTVSAFIYWAPLTYGTPITDKALESRMWLPTWR